MKTIKIAISVLLILTGLSYGGGKIVQQPLTKPISVATDSWSGPYIGLSLGYIKGDGDTSLSRFNYAGYNTINYQKLNSQPDGFIGGAFIGVNKVLSNNWLIGVELSGNYLNNSEKLKLSYRDGTASNLSLDLKQKNEGALYVRAGKIFDDTFMPYVLGGVTTTKLYGTLTENGIDYRASDRVNGYTLGAGVEYKINKNLHARAQYRFSKYKDAEFNYSIGSDNLKGVADFKTHSFSVGISYRY
jgi:outer membrane immunogenic protein